MLELFAHDYPHDYPEVEAVLLMHDHRLASMDIPVVMRHRIGGVSSINSTRSIYYMLKVLLAVFVGLFRARPVPEPGDNAPVAAEPGISAVDVSRLQLLAILVQPGCSSSFSSSCAGVDCWSATHCCGFSRR